MTAQMLSNKSSLSSEKTLWSDKGSKSEVLANIYNKEKILLSGKENSQERWLNLQKIYLH